MNNIITESDRLKISELNIADANFILQLVNEPAFLEYIGDKEIQSREEAKKFIELGPISSYRENGFGFYRVSLKENDISVGICGLKQRKSLTVPDLGYAFLKNYRGKGYATEAGLAVLQYAKKDLDIDTLAAITATHNEASIHLLQKLGFDFEKRVHLPEFDSVSNLYMTNL
ncbi:GNAT family N-acetyltransferase [Fodinibius halophilus]|uniref:GNAT family N-acetyltransferase n=1 Tax=Fodinibius halophilus TaxID=1736908 RepID=A0A6M1T8C4_9BACT|nr:GNAT family N-acetyltransferase [Fodinibius halophilus]NGP88853.1 GNAT family N-acetyltransferase [Fodinibius halophilus]